MRSAFDANARNKIVFASSADDARDLARMAPSLDREDFMALPPYEVYAQVVDHGAPSGWFSARTLAPEPSRGTREAVLQSSRERFGASDGYVSTPAPDEPETGASGHRKARRS